MKTQAGKNVFSIMRIKFSFAFPCFICLCISSSLNAQGDYTENFDKKGKPSFAGYYWYKTSNIYPAWNDWNTICPGDGHAYLKVDPDTRNDIGGNPYQTIALGTVRPGRRIEVRMKNAVQPGLVGFIFTYSESGNRFNEIDIELVADDADTNPVNHNITTHGGWTDVRFNTWRNANTSTYLPGTNINTRIKNSARQNISHYNDNLYHTYRIDWYPNKVDYYIDGVKQTSISNNIATGESELLIGFRDLSWAGPFKFSGVKTLDIDWVKITTLAEPGGSGTTEYKYDVGTPSSPVFSGYTRLSDRQRAGRFGWTNTQGISSRDRRASGSRNDINRDINFSSSTRTFTQDVSNGSWNVLITFGDTYARKNMNVKAEGQNKLSNINTMPNQYLSRSFDVMVNDGKLNLDFSVGRGGDVWSVTRIWIRKR